MYQNRLASFEVDHDKKEEVNQIQETPDLEFKGFMGAMEVLKKQNMVLQPNNNDICSRFLKTTH